MEWGELIGYIAGLCMTFCFLPQTILTLRTKNVQGLSAISYFVYSFGVACWVIYGAYLKAAPMVIFNSISFVFATTIFVTIISQRGKHEKN